MEEPKTKASPKKNKQISKQTITNTQQINVWFDYFILVRGDITKLQLLFENVYTKQSLLLHILVTLWAHPFYIIAS